MGPAKSPVVFPCDYLMCHPHRPPPFSFVDGKDKTKLLVRRRQEEKGPGAGPSAERVSKKRRGEERRGKERKGKERKGSMSE